MSADEKGLTAMASEPIHVDDNSNLNDILDEASERPVRLERKGVVYRLALDETENGSSKDYDPEALRSAIDRVSGLFSDEEAEQMIEQIYEWRREGSRPASRP